MLWRDGEKGVVERSEGVGKIKAEGGDKKSKLTRELFGKMWV